MNAQGERVSVTHRALLQRVNVALGRQGRRVKGARGRGGKPQPGFGRYHLVNLRRGTLLEKDVNLEALGRELGVLHPWEILAEDAP